MTNTNGTPKRAPASLAGKQLTDQFHVCAFFRSREEELRVLAPFIGEGLERGERAMWIVDPALREEQPRRLAEAGVNVRDYGDRFEFKTWEETYLKDGHFDPERMLNTVRETFESVQDGTQIRLIGQMEWVHRNAPGTDLLLEYEVQCNDVISRAGHPAVCCYQADKLSAGVMMDLLRVHPLAIIGGVLYENPFYMPPEQMLAEFRSRRRAA